MPKRFVFIFLLFPALLLAQSQDLATWKGSFANAEKEFNSRNQYSSVALFQNLAQQITDARKNRNLSQEELTILFKSLDYLGQVFFNYNELDKTREAFTRLAALNPNYKFDEDYVSPKIIEYFNQIKKEVLAPVSITSEPTQAEVRVDGAAIGMTQLDGFLSKGAHTIEVKKKGFKTQSKSVQIAAGPNQIQFQLEAQKGLASDITQPELSQKYETAFDKFTQSGDKVAMASELEQIGSELEKASDLETARKVYEESLNLYRQSSNTDGIASSTFSLGMILSRQGKQEAQKILEESLALNRQKNDQAKVAAISLQLADAQFQAGKLDTAKSMYQDSLTFLRAGNDKAKLAEVLARLGDISSSQKSIPSAMDFYRESQTLYQAAGDTNGARRVEASLNKILDDSQYEIAAVLGRANTLMNQRNNGEAEVKFQEGLALARAVGDKRNMMIAFVNLGYLLNIRKDPGCEKMYEDGLALARELNDKNSMAICLLGLGFQLSNRGDLAGAQVKYQEALDIARKAGDKRNTALALYNLANTVYLLGDQGQANRLYDESSALYKELGETPRPRMW